MKIKKLVVKIDEMSQNLKNQQNNETAILTVTYNSSDHLERFLKSAILSVSDKKNVVIVDNNSDDYPSTKRLCVKYKVTFIKLEKNVGYGAAINKAVEKLSPDISTIVVANPDTVLNPNAIINMVSLTAKDQTGVVGPKIFDEQGQIYPSARKFPTIFMGSGHALFSSIFPNNVWSKKYHSTTHLEATTAKTDWVSGACFAINLNAFKKCGGFDEGYFMYFEDIDIAKRLSAMGYINYFCPEATVEHTGGLSTRKYEKNMMIAHHASAYRYVSKNLSNPILGPVKLILRVGLQIRLLFLLSILKIKKRFQEKDFY